MQTAAAAFMDLDKTIIAGSSSLAFSRPLRRHGLIDRRTVLRGTYAHLLLMVAGADADFMARLRAALTRLCTGWEVEAVRTVVTEALRDVVQPMIYAEAAELIAEHRSRGDAVVVLSASGAEIVAPIAGLVGADDFVATLMAVADGRYTGEIEFYCYGEHKATAAREIAARHGYDLAACSAYTDSITDLPLLEVVGHPVAVNPDRALRREAARRGWPVFTFAHPVRMPPLLRQPRLAGLLAGALAAIVVLRVGWIGMRKRRSPATVRD